MSIEKMALVAFLATSPVLYGKVFEIRKAIGAWLSYIPNTFPHYTRHTIEHSEQIIEKLSHLLFHNTSNPDTSVVQLSPIEAYILIAAAYFHDAGMVVSDSEKQQLLWSDDWKAWINGEGNRQKRLKQIEKLRHSRKSADEFTHNFLADIQIRFLISEFIRASHHSRTANLLQQHENALGGFAFGSSMLARSISDVCVSHGLMRHQLQDNDRFPERRDIMGQPANLRFLSILLRIGDLLDMSYDRACPLLLNAASPLPSESLAHWNQYQRFTHELVAPNRIELTAECQTQEEHRFIMDWCQWLVEEVKNSAAVMARAERHSDWKPPHVELEGADQTVKIRPAPGASYFFSKWQFELDQDLVFQRLINDVYDHPFAFVRELIQNALDANRCQMYLDLRKDDLEEPEYPKQISEDRRRRYPVHVTLKSTKVHNPLSGKSENRQVLIVEDCGIGMDEEIVQRYFLQVARSYYSTEEFRKSFRFSPSSRFGLGFLSVFAVSNFVAVETYKPTSVSPKPIRMILTGPKNYLLTEIGKRRTGGTTIEVTLRNPMRKHNLTALIYRWCRRVEFPIVVDDLGAKTTVQAERAEEFTEEIADDTRAGARFFIRAFPLNSPGIEGELYILAYQREAGESWTSFSYAQTLPNLHPRISPITFPANLLCINGIDSGTPPSLSFPESFSHLWGRSVRLDIRREIDQVRQILSRTGTTTSSDLTADIQEVNRHWKKVLADHVESTPLSKGLNGWKYVQRLVDCFPLPELWNQFPETIPVYERGKVVKYSLEEVSMRPIFTVAKELTKLDRGARNEMFRNKSPLITEDMLNSLSESHRIDLFSHRIPVSIRFVKMKMLLIDWKMMGKADRFFDYVTLAPFDLVDLKHDNLLAIAVHRTVSRAFEHVLLNLKHPFVNWLTRVKEACYQEEYSLSKENFLTIMTSLQKFMLGSDFALEDYLEKWRNLSDLPKELLPPDIAFVNQGNGMWWDGKEAASGSDSKL